MKVLLVAVLCAALDPVEVATRHEQAGRPELALHLLDAITQGQGDAAAQAVRERLKGKLGRTRTDNSAPAPAVPKPRPSAGGAPAGEDPVPLFKRKEYLRAAKLFRARLEANAQDFSSFSYLTNCYWQEAERLVADGKQAEAASVYDEGVRAEQMYGGAFAGELSGSTAPEGLAQRVGR